MGIPDDANPLNRCLPAEVVTRKKPTKKEEKEEPALNVDAKQVHSMKPELRLKWLGKALQRCQEGKVEKTLIFDILTNAKFCHDCSSRLGAKMYRLVLAHADFFSPKQRKHLQVGDCPLRRLFKKAESDETLEGKTEAGEKSTGHFGRRGRQSHLCLAPGRVGRAGAFAAPVPQRGAARGLRGARGGTLDSRPQVGLVGHRPGGRRTGRMGLEPRKSIGTSSFVVLATSASAVCTYIHEGLASLRAAGAIAVTAVISARMGASMTNKVKPKTLKKGFGAWLLLVSVVIMAKALRLLPVHSSVTHAGATAALLPLSGLGIASGLVSGLLGVGGGTVLVPVLALAFAFPQSEAQGSALLAMLLPSVVSSSTHWSKGNVDRDLVGFAVLGALLGGFGGGEMAALLPERALRLIFAAVLSVVAVKYIRS